MRPLPDASPTAFFNEASGTHEVVLRLGCQYGLRRAHRIFRPAAISRLGRMIRSYPLRSVAFGASAGVVPSNSGRIRAHGSVRVEFESTAAVRPACLRRKATKDRPARVRIPKGIRMVVGHELTFEMSGIAGRP
jgi:hypothetical protein